MTMGVDGYIRNTTSCYNLVYGYNKTFTATKGLVGTITNIEMSWLIIGFGIFSGLLATGFSAIRKHIHKDKNVFDTAFDAGGKVSSGLTATTIVSQWTWAATLLQSATVASKYGISGPFWYAAGATIQILLFSIISAQLKIRAPGAKTFLQVIRARFDRKTHITFCVFGLLTNLIVTAMLMLGGAAVLTSLVKGLNVEFATVLVVAVIGTYTFIGGLGATFYVSYFNTALIYIIMLIIMQKVYNDPDNSSNPLGSKDIIYQFVGCSKGPAENLDNSYLTIMSKQGLMFGLINIVGNFGTVFVDQSYWQSSVAAKPKEGVFGFLLGGICWFAIPFAFASTTGLGYIALSAQQDSPLLDAASVDSGLIPPLIAQKLLGRPGEFLICVMLLMAVTSTGSAEVMAVTSILVYDVYQVYLKPFRMVLDSNTCILCGKARGRLAVLRDKCKCESMTNCIACKNDDKEISMCKRTIKPQYMCKTHGNFRIYVDYLLRLKNWCLMWTVLCIIPLTVLLKILTVSLSWLYLFMGILIGSAVIPIILCMFWEKLTGPGMIAGGICGTVAALIAWLSVSSLYSGGLYDFINNTGKELPMLIGNITSICVGGLVCVLVSCFQSHKKGSGMCNETWELTRDIDSPLSPWTELYATDLGLKEATSLDCRPDLEHIKKTFRMSSVIAIVGGLGCLLLLIVVWPTTMIASGVLNNTEFNIWVTVGQVWAYLAALFIIVVPIITEGMDIVKTYNENTKVHSEISVDKRRSTMNIKNCVSEPSKSKGKYKEKSTLAENDINVTADKIIDNDELNTVNLI
ncbi:uncharacterized protein [Mytilus edulis]|uniref:uncharacterized protein isoform X1 n=1 Tax=Mytilus edulis TaxID=6550 RepID=UPI0039EF91D5